MSEYFTQYDDVLENKLGIHDPQIIKQIEEEIVPVRTAEIFSSFQFDDFDFETLKKIHYNLFSDIYQMAGKVRSVDMIKDGSSVPFCYVNNIRQEQSRIFGSLKKDKYYSELDRETFVKKIAWLSSELNALHPFRDGNGRTIRVFLVLLAANAGYELDYSRVDEKLLIEADIRAFYGDLKALESLYETAIGSLKAGE